MPIYFADFILKNASLKTHEQTLKLQTVIRTPKVKIENIKKMPNLNEI